MGLVGTSGVRIAAPVVWFTGLSGAGKTTLAGRVAEHLRRSGRPFEELDGDRIRAVLPGTGFSAAERDAHVRRVGFTASLLARHGVWVVVALISPYRASRDFVRGLCPDFVEVHVSTPLEECERRDPKGLYARARRGELRNVTGLDDPYEAPVSPEVELDTRHVGVEEGVRRVRSRLGLGGSAGPTP